MDVGSETTRNLVWQGLLDIARFTRYYAALERRYRRKHRYVRFLLGTVSVCTALPLIPAIPPIVSSVGAIGIVGLVVWDLVHDYGRLVGTLRLAAEGLNDLETRHRHLWDEVQNGTLSDDEARRQTTDLSREALNLLRGLDFDTDSALNERCQKETFQAEKKRYASG